MARHGGRLIALLGVLVVVAACARGQDVIPRTGRQLQLDYQVTKDARGAVVRGNIGNPFAVPARDIHLLVEGLDPGGNVVTSTTSAIRRIVLAGERAPFDVFVPGAAEQYRVSVVAFDLVLPRGGR